jgi:polyhydroxyalkanoate synthesis regulator phasin
MSQDVSTLLSQVVQLAHQVAISVQIMEQTVIHGAERMNAAGDHIKASADEAAGKLSIAGGGLAQSMEVSAESIEKASDYFYRNSSNSAQVMSASLEEVSELLASIKPISDNMINSGRHLVEMSGNLDQAADKMNIWVTDYDRHRILLEGLMRQITDMVHQADTRNDLGRRQVEQIHQLVVQLRMAQQEAARFGQQVSSVMSRSYDDFTSTMLQSMQTISSQHQTNITASMRSIAQQFESLDQRLKDVSARHTDQRTF